MSKNLFRLVGYGAWKNRIENWVGEGLQKSIENGWIYGVENVFRLVGGDLNKYNNKNMRITS